MIPNDDMPPRQPDEDEPLEHEAGDVLDFIDETVAQITDADVDEHLRKVLDRAGYRTDPSLRFNSIMEFQAGSSQDNMADLIAAAARMQVEPWRERLRQAQQAIEDARLEADRIAAEAREEADEALSQAAKMIREAREQAERIISDAQNEAEQILAAARNQQVHETTCVEYGGAFECKSAVQVFRPPAERLATDAAAFGRFADVMGITVATNQHLPDRTGPSLFDRSDRWFSPGRGGGGIAFADEHRSQEPEEASALGKLLSVTDSGPLLAFFRCYATSTGADIFSGAGASLVRARPGVVAMQSAAAGDAANVFSQAFYQALVHNRGIDEAVRAGRIALTGWNPNTLGLVAHQDARLAAVGGADMTFRLWNPHTGHGDLDGLRALANAVDRDTAWRLANLVAERSDLDGAARILPALADADDEAAASRLADLLAALLIKQDPGEKAGWLVAAASETRPAPGVGDPAAYSR